MTVKDDAYASQNEGGNRRGVTRVQNKGSERSIVHYLVGVKDGNEDSPGLTLTRGPKSVSPHARLTSQAEDQQLQRHCG